MSMYEPYFHEISIKRWIFWYLISGVKIQLSIENDPVEFVDWMIKNIGRCGHDWDWDWLIDYNISGTYVSYIVKLRKKRSHLTSLILLRFKT